MPCEIHKPICNLVFSTVIVWACAYLAYLASQNVCIKRMYKLKGDSIQEGILYNIPCIM